MQSTGWPVWVGDAGPCPPMGAELIAVAGFVREGDALPSGLRST